MPSNIETIYAQLGICETQYEASFSTEPDLSAPYQFELCRKQTTLGVVPIEHFWMPIRTLYGQRRRCAANQQAIVDFWWAVCGDRSTQGEESVQDSYVLAKILPHARSNGSRKVFLDSFQTVPDTGGQKVQVWVKELDDLLVQSRHEKYDEVEFRDSTADMIGPPSYPENVQDKYAQMESDLLGECRRAIQSGEPEALTIVLGNWERLMNSIGRRRGNPIEKQVLDIFSYECRAALHRCYSAVWCILLPAVAQEYAMNEESFIFHQLWHFDRCRESDYGDQAYFHLFHGHVFALHPASGPLLLTKTGGELFGKWLTEGTLDSYHHVLHALAVAVGYYDQQYNITSLLRKKERDFQQVEDIVAFEEQELDRRSGRRRMSSHSD